MTEFDPDRFEAEKYVDYFPKLQRAYKNAFETTTALVTVANSAKKTAAFRSSSSAQPATSQAIATNFTSHSPTRPNSASMAARTALPSRSPAASPTMVRTMSVTVVTRMSAQRTAWLRVMRRSRRSVNSASSLSAVETTGTTRKQDLEAFERSGANAVSIHTHINTLALSGVWSRST